MPTIPAVAGKNTYFIQHTPQNSEISVRRKDTSEAIVFDANTITPVGMSSGIPESDITYSVNWKDAAKNGLEAIHATDRKGNKVPRIGSGVDLIPEALTALESAAANAANATKLPAGINDKVQHMREVLGLPSQRIQR